MGKKVTISTLAKRYAAGEKLVMVTAYDTPSAKLAERAGVDFLLVGDSVAMTTLGYTSTLPMTMDMMLHHTRAVRRGAPDAFVVLDMPFMSYQADEAEALRNAARALKEADADAVKLEGGAEFAPLVKRMVDAGIPVMGHLGLLPQRVNALGGYKVAGRSEAEAERILQAAQALEAAGAFSVVLECVPAEVGSKITADIHIPTIGIGSGNGCSGQVQVWHDLFGLGGEFLPHHAKRYVDAGSLIESALRNYADEVRSGEFPGKENSF